MAPLLWLRAETKADEHRTALTPAVVQQLNAAFVEAIRLPDVKARFAEQGAEPVGNTSEQMGRFVRDEAVRWARIIKDANVTVD